MNQMGNFQKLLDQKLLAEPQDSVSLSNLLIVVFCLERSSSV